MTIRQLTIMEESRYVHWSKNGADTVLFSEWFSSCLVQSEFWSWSDWTEQNFGPNCYRTKVVFNQKKEKSGKNRSTTKPNFGLVRPIFWTDLFQHFFSLNHRIMIIQTGLNFTCLEKRSVINTYISHRSKKGNLSNSTSYPC